MRKPAPLNVGDPVALSVWLDEVRALKGDLHAVGIDATSPDRVHSRKELRKRFCRLVKRLGALLDAVEPSGPSSADDGAANDPSGEPPPDGRGAPDAA